MRLDINPRGNGACPLCDHHGDCHLQKLVAGSLADKDDPQDMGMEIVIYSCPSFVEKAGS